MSIFNARINIKIILSFKNLSKDMIHTHTYIYIFQVQLEFLIELMQILSHIKPQLLVKNSKEIKKLTCPSTHYHRHNICVQLMTEFIRCSHKELDVIAIIQPIYVRIRVENGSKKLFKDKECCEQELSTIVDNLRHESTQCWLSLYFASRFCFLLL